MNKDITLLTSESVTEGHPDKMCDMISDALLDAYLKEDPSAHVALETMASEDTTSSPEHVHPSHRLMLKIRQERLSVKQDMTVKKKEQTETNV